VHTFHGHLLHGYFSPTKTRAVIAVERGLARGTTRFAVVGEQVRDELLAARIGKPSQYVVVPPGVNLPTAPSRQAARADLDLDPRAHVVAFVARLTGVKRPDRFAEMAHHVSEMCADAIFIVGGEGELLADLRARVAGLGDRVRFLGWRPDVETLYAAADVVVLTSDNEGMPVSLIEAAMCGRAAVTTNAGSAPEVVRDGDTGLVTAKDARRLAEAVVRLLTAPVLAARMGERAAEVARDRFGVERLVADTARIYNEVALEKRLP
jgi:glycosyltransferase involved in cell wall biosynthesis